MIVAKLSAFSTHNFDKGASSTKQVLWYFVNALFIRASWNPFMGIKRFALRAFGAKLGKGLIIKNNVNIKFPWKLTVGDNVWLGENCWIDNLETVTIGNNVCISQAALLLTGNHDYTLSAFYYRNAPIILEDGVWIGAKAVVCPGVTAFSHSILTVGAIATKDMDSWGIYQGNPAKKTKIRQIIQ